MHIATRLQACEIYRQGLIRKHKKLLSQIALLSPEEEVVVTPDFKKGESVKELNLEISNLVEAMARESCCVSVEDGQIIIRRTLESHETRNHHG